MASSKAYLEIVLAKLSNLEEISYRAMMGEFILYYRGKIIGGIYDDRFLIKAVDAAKQLMPDASFEIPYDGAKAMLLIDDAEEKAFLEKLFRAVYDELSAAKKKQNHKLRGPTEDSYVTSGD